MTFGLRIFLGYFLIVGLGAYFMMSTIMTVASRSTSARPRSDSGRRWSTSGPTASP